jgi:hypothetical protein
VPPEATSYMHTKPPAPVVVIVDPERPPDEEHEFGVMTAPL